MTLTEYPKVEQGSPEWHDLRRGVVTASVVGKLLTVGAPGALNYACPDCTAAANSPCISRGRKVATPIKTMHDGRTAVAIERAKDAPPVIEVADNDTSRAITAGLVAERLTGFTEPTRMTDDMFRGVESEPIARDIYSAHYQQAEEIGFMLREESGWKLGYSPDGLVGVDGLIEIKAPRAKTHLATILADKVPAYYMAQCMAGLLVTGRDWIDFVSYCGGMPLYVKRVRPSGAWFKAITEAVQKFEDNAWQMETTYKAATTGLAQTERVDLNDLGLVF